jgi:ankyrin repeat protein
MDDTSRDKEKDFQKLLRDACNADSVAMWDAAEEQFGIASAGLIDKANLVDRCAVKGAPAVLRRCHERGANLLQEGADGSTPIHAAAENDNVFVVETLLDLGVPVGIEIGAIGNTFDIGGFTPLHSAAANNSGDCCRLLLDRGANLHAVCNNDTTPFEQAFIGGTDDDVVMAFLHHGIDDAQMSNFRFKHTFNPNKEILTPFQVAVQLALLKTVEYYLTERGEDPAQRTGRGVTMPLLSARGGSLDSAPVRALLLAHKSKNLIAAAVVSDPSDKPATKRARTPAAPI